MQRIINLFVLVLLANIAIAQAPQGIPYQAVARNSSGTILVSAAISVRFTIRDSIATGAIKYQETFSVTTTAQGMFNVNVGQGTPVTGTFSGINWGTNAKFMQVEMDPAGGSSYIDMGTQQMMSVPFALHSGSAATISGALTTGQLHRQVFTSSGTFTTSANITGSTIFHITVVGGGGAGNSGGYVSGIGWYPANYSRGAGGGAGGTAIFAGNGLSPLTNYTIIIGAGGNYAVNRFGGPSSAYAWADSGRSSSCNLGYINIIATGGEGGFQHTNSTYVYGGNGGHGVNGNINLNGSPGQGDLGNTNNSIPVYGGGSYFGRYNYGSGGDGVLNCNNCAGSSGNAGIVIIEWME